MLRVDSWLVRAFVAAAWLAYPGSAAADELHAPIPVAEATDGLAFNPGLVTEESLVLEYGRTYRLPLRLGSRHSPFRLSVQAFGMYQDAGRQEPTHTRLVDNRSLSPSAGEDLTVEIDTRRLPRPRVRVEGRPSEAAIAGLYFDVQVSFFDPPEFDRLRILLVERPDSESAPALVAAGGYWPLERVAFDVAGEIPPDAEPGLANVKRGRYLPGGGVIPDLYLPEFDRDRANARNYLVTPDALDRLDPFFPRRLPEGNPWDEAGGPVGEHFARESYRDNNDEPLRFNDAATGISRIWIQPIGPHRLDFQSERRAVLDSTAVTATLPDLPGSIRLEPAGNGEAFDITDPPDIVVDLAGLRAPMQPGLYPAHFSTEQGVLPEGRLPIRLQLVRLRRGGIASIADVAGQPLMDGAPQSTDWARPGAIERFSIVPYYLRPGRYRARLVVGDYRLDHIEFDVGGRGNPTRYGSDYAAPSPMIEFGGVTLAAEPGRTSVLGAPVRIQAQWPDELALDSQQLFVQLFLAPHYAYDCARRIGRYVGPPVRLASGGSAVLPAPPEPGRYEAHLFRPYDWSDSAKDALEAAGRLERPTDLQLWQWQGGSAPFVEPLARVMLDVDAPAAPGAIGIGGGSEFESSQPVPVTVDPPDAGPTPHHYELELWLAARNLPGGGFRRAVRLREGPAFRFGSDTAPERSASMTVTEEGLETTLMVTIEESFELRLWDATVGYYVDRLAFDVYERDGPPMPPSGRVAAELSDWPTRNERLRGLEAWLKPPVWCETPEFPEPPVLRLVHFISGDPDNPGDNEFVTADGVFPGHPFFVEAEFETAPPDDLYRVDFGPSEAFLVERTDDPRVYRSGALNVVPEAP